MWTRAGGDQGGVYTARADRPRSQGNMGLPMARNLAAYLETENLAPLHVQNRTPSKLPAESAQFKHVQSPKELAKTCDVVVTSLANDEAAKSVYKELFEGAKEKKDGRGTIFVDTSTLYPLTCGEWALCE